MQWAPRMAPGTGRRAGEGAVLVELVDVTAPRAHPQVAHLRPPEALVHEEGAGDEDRLARTQRLRGRAQPPVDDVAVHLREQQVEGRGPPLQQLPVCLQLVHAALQRRGDGLGLPGAQHRNHRRVGPRQLGDEAGGGEDVLRGDGHAAEGHEHQRPPSIAGLGRAYHAGAWRDGGWARRDSTAELGFLELVYAA